MQTGAEGDRGFWSSPFEGLLVRTGSRPHFSGLGRPGGPGLSPVSQIPRQGALQAPFSGGPGVRGPPTFGTARVSAPWRRGGRFKSAGSSGRASGAERSLGLPGAQVGAPTPRPGPAPTRGSRSSSPLGLILAGQNVLGVQSCCASSPGLPLPILSLLDLFFLGGVS